MNYCSLEQTAIEHSWRYIIFKISIHTLQWTFILCRNHSIKTNKNLPSGNIMWRWNFWGKWIERIGLIWFFFSSTLPRPLIILALRCNTILFSTFFLLKIYVYNSAPFNMTFCLYNQRTHIICFTFFSILLVYENYDIFYWRVLDNK